MGKSEKLEKAVIYSYIRKIIDGVEPPDIPFPATYHTTEVSTGAFEILRQIGDDPDIVEIVPRNALAADITKYCSEAFNNLPEYQLTANDGKACAEYYAFVSPKKAKPKIFLWPDERGLAYTRLPWRPVEGPCDTWVELLSRMPNNEAFKAWIGSLFYPDSDVQQYVWIYGQGNDGKGSINRFLSRIFGPAYVSKQPPGRDGARFWTHGFLGKRLAVFPDCNDTQFITSGLFKSMTGGDPIPVETKGGMAYTANLDCKYLIISNDRPEVTSEGSDRRRIIYCPMEPRPPTAINDAAFERLLWAEGGAFLWMCMEAYERSLSLGRRILSLGDDLDQIIETNEMHFQEAFDFHFRIDDRKDQYGEWTEEAKDSWATGVVVQKGLNLAFKSRKLQREFLAWMEREKCVKKKQFRCSKGERRWLYEGLIARYPYLVTYPSYDENESGH